MRIDQDRRPGLLVGASHERGGTQSSTAGLFGLASLVAIVAVIVGAAIHSSKPPEAPVAEVEVVTASPRGSAAPPADAEPTTVLPMLFSISEPDAGGRHAFMGASPADARVYSVGDRIAAGAFVVAVERGRAGVALGSSTKWIYPEPGGAADRGAPAAGTLLRESQDRNAVAPPAPRGARHARLRGDAELPIRRDDADATGPGGAR